MPSLVVVVPGSIDTRTGGYGYDRRIVGALRAAGWDVRVLELTGSFPAPSRSDEEGAAAAFAEIPDQTTVLVDGLALGALPAIAEREATRLQLIALVHHPLARETGIDRALARKLEVSERRALAAVRHVVVTSGNTADGLADYGIGADRIAVVEPGTDPAPLARGSRETAVHLVCVAAIAPRKGHELLLRALTAVRGGEWRLTCVGSVSRDPETAARLRRAIRDRGFEERVTLAGELEGAALDAAYDSADVFVLPTLYEGYGMAVAEAIARGLPVVSTDTGAIRRIVGAGGIVVPPGDEGALADALGRVVGDPALRERLTAAARAMRERLTRWDDAGRRMAEVVSVDVQP